MKFWLRRHAGFALFMALSLLSLVRLLLQAVPGHYRVFTGAGRALWLTQNPYGTDFGTHVGYYFYSPTCALTFFGPLSALPEKLGIIVFMLVSWVVFVVGVIRFFNAFAHERRLTTLQWFWVAISAQMVGGILASKLEIIIVGILLLATAWMVDESKRLSAKSIAAATLLAMVLNWKFQPLPMVGLLMVSWIFIRRDLKWPAIFSAALGFFYLLPFLFFPRELLISFHEVWQKTFSHFVQEAFLNFENLFAFLHSAFNIPFTFAASQIISAAVGASFVLFLAAWLKRSQGSNTSERLRGAFLLSVALGSMFMTVLSPLGQNNALILYAPLLLTGFLCWDAASGIHRRHWSWILMGVWTVMTLSYSDLMPLDARNALRGLYIKPLACLALGIAVAYESWRTQVSSAR